MKKKSIWQTITGSREMSLVAVLIVLLIVNIGLDWWLLRKFKRDKKWPRLKSVSHAVLSLLLMVMLIVAIAIPHRTCGNGTFVAIMWMLYIYYTFYVPRYLAALVWMPTHLKKSGKLTRKVGGIAATALGVLVFIYMWIGLLFVPYQVHVERLELEFENLPAEFDGYRIVQFSDLHLGTYNGDTQFVQEVVGYNLVFQRETFTRLVFLEPRLQIGAELVFLVQLDVLEVACHNDKFIESHKTLEVGHEILLVLF